MPRHSSPSDSLRRAHEALLFALHHSDDRLDAVARVARICVELLPVDGASVSLIFGPDRRETLFASNEVVAGIEALQFGLGEGPCFEAARLRSPVLISDLRATTVTAWPIFAAEAADRPIGAIFAFPLMNGEISVGALDLYRTAPGRLSTTDVAIAMQVAAIVTVALLGERADDQTTWWTDVPFNRAHIHQATGMVSAASHLTAPDALARLRSYAYATGRLLDDVADDLVTRRVDPVDLDRP